MNELPCAPSCERNRAPIEQVLVRHIQQPATLIEIGSGTGQHGYYFSERFPRLRWQPTDCAGNLTKIRQWVAAADRENFLSPQLLDVTEPAAIANTYDYLYSANTLHIMSWQAVQAFFSLVPMVLRHGGLLFVYGPFNYAGQFSSESNAQFDRMLRASDPQQGIRDFEQVNLLAEHGGLTLIEDNAMPANNRLLIWRQG